METQRREDHQGRGQRRRLSQDGEELSQILQALRWPSADRPPTMGRCRRVRGDDPDLFASACGARQLRRDGPAHQGRPSENEGHAQGDGWVGNHDCRVMSAHFSPVAAAREPDRVESGPGYWAVGDGAPVVLLHSSLSSKSQWSVLADRLALRFRVIALDLCGYGDNALPAPHPPFALEHEVDLIAARLNRLVPPRVRLHVVGHSYGGLVALRFAQHASDRIASLSVYEAVAFG